MANLTPGTVLQGRYLVTDEIGKGAMAVVYGAQDQTTGTRVAIKQMGSYAQSPEEWILAAQQFEQEARLLHDLNHPNIPRVHEWFEESQERYLIMDFVDGEVLGQRVNLSGDGPPAALPAPAEVVGWAIQIVQALRYLHSQKPRPVIYKDLKPDNLMLTRSGHIKMLDFGIAKGRDAKGRYFTILKGMVTPGFAAPEQYSQQATDPRADIYSLGATTYALLTGRVPPESIARQQHFLNGNGDPLVPITRLRPEVSAALEEAITKMMAIKRKDRLQTADIVLDLLARVPEAAAFRTSVAAPVSTPARTTGSLLGRATGSLLARAPRSVPAPAAAPPSVRAPVAQPGPAEPDLEKEWGATRQFLYLGGGLLLAALLAVAFVVWWMAGTVEP